MGISIHSSNAELVHVNIRKEGPEEDQIVAIDLKFSCEAPAEVVKQLFGTDEVPDLWMDNEDKDPHWLTVTGITTDSEFEQCALSFGSVKFKFAKIKKCSFRPRPKRLIDLTFSASISNPGRSEVSTLAEYVKENLPLSVISPPDLFDANAA